jgi:adenylyl-sulfate kinase
MHKGFILWFTGLSGAWKSTLSAELVLTFQHGHFKVEMLDGDEIRTNLSKGLGFSREDRDTNIRRIGYVARLLARNGVITITAAISPYREIRQEVRIHAEQNGISFIEVFANASLDALVSRDVKGLYKKALAGEITNFTGVSDPYEHPLNPEIEVKTDSETVQESSHKILHYLREKGYISMA